MAKYTVTLTKQEWYLLTQITKKGKHKSTKIRNAYILLNTDEGEYGNKRTNEQICKILNVGMRTIDRIKKKFVEEGLDVALNGRPTTRNYKRKIDGDTEAHIIALSCSEPPEGFAKWSLRLLADKAVELKYVENISHETIRKTLKKTN